MTLIRIKEKGEKGSWWNKFVDNYFMVSSHANSFIIECLSNEDRDECGDTWKGLTLPVSCCEVMDKSMPYGVRGNIRIEEAGDGKVD